MAVIAVAPRATINNFVDVWNWLLLTQATLDTGTPVRVDNARAIQALLVSGTLGAAGAVLWEGSDDDGTTWFGMTSDIGAPAAASQVALLTPVMLKERPILVRPRVTAGDGTTSLNVRLTVTRQV